MPSSGSERGVRERPVIFSAPMVRAILAGRKTQTRRLSTSPLRKCEPGDLLWVRETLKARNMDLLGALGLVEPMTTVNMTRKDLCVSYAADDEPAIKEHGFDLAWVWKRPSVPSIHMPRQFCRITLRVTGVKIERLQDISREDALAEGVDGGCGPGYDFALHAFKSLWEALHGAGAWERNDEVVAITFERIATPPHTAGPG